MGLLDPILGTENVERYRGQLNELKELEKRIEKIRKELENQIVGLRNLLEVGKDRWHGQTRNETNDTLDGNYYKSIVYYYNGCISPLWEAIRRRKNELRDQILEEEGILQTITCRNIDIRIEDILDSEFN